MNKVFKVGLVGCGHISETYFRAEKYFNNIKIIKCADINPDASEKCSKIYKIKSSSIDNIFKDEERKKIAILASKTDHCLLEILWRWRSGEINADIPLIISNHDTLEKEVNSFGIPFYHLPIDSKSKKNI